MRESSCANELIRHNSLVTARLVCAVAEFKLFVRQVSLEAALWTLAGHSAQLEDQIVMAGFQAFSFIFVAGLF